MEFHISRKARDKYNFDKALFRLSGTVVFSDFKAVRHFAAQLEDEKTRAGEVNAMGLMHEVFHYVFRLYKEQKNPRLSAKTIAQLQKNLGKKTLDTALRVFAGEFPPTAVYRGDCSLDEYMKGTTDGIPNRHIIMEELMMLWLNNVNPACEPYKKKLFNDAALKKHSAYQAIIEQLELFFAAQPFFGPKNQNLLAMLRSPAVAVPDSLGGQLEYIREHWGSLLGDFLARLLSGLDLLEEEEKFRGPGPGETPVPDFSGVSFDEEYERFTADRYWMPRLVLMAKSTHVWLDQLSKTYKRPISRLDQIPDRELDELAKRGFTGLWLIGVWERSQASRKIKQMCGNPEALASAYSIYQYRPADDLGGEEALNNLKHRAWQRGIRLASDMVPNHMGIDSPWLAEHPDWFLSLDYCPYPSYSFNGPNLSSDHRVSIFLEDHYYDRTDAAVVFKWVDNHTGAVRYIYHGNDGTSMPWNDTAQLNYLNPEVREAVIHAIFSVAAKFPIIRFDAAMTITKRHFQRLWFPEPGFGGDIPTRAGNGMNKAEFHHLMPEEFWRQVVDRFAGANADTLLLAEAFWLMEAYFVRTLGMHRVYNSAFMNFLKNEHNEEFRSSIKNVLQFNPGILKRYVNFVNNPDEETAAAQFGKDDKYFGVCTLMVTLPGLPMFGHGQIEGFEEKYGMEYRRAYWDETPDQNLVERHEREIFPLMRKRYLFADVEHFLFYDFYTPEGGVNEDVIAFSNRFGDDRALVIYHNKYAETAGWVKTSVPFLIKSGGENSSSETLIRKDLAAGLGLTPKDNYYTVFRDYAAGLEYIRGSKELFEKGFYVELKAFKKHVLLDFRQVEDNREGIYSQLAGMLQGKGVPDIDDTLRKHFLNPLRSPFQEVVNPEVFRRLLLETKSTSVGAVLGEMGIETKLEVFLTAVRELTGGKGNPHQIAGQICRTIEQFVILAGPDNIAGPVDSPGARQALQYAATLLQNTSTDSYRVPLILAWIFVRQLGEVMKMEKTDTDGAKVWQLLEDWLLIETITDVFTALGAPHEKAYQHVKSIKLLLFYRQWWETWKNPGDRDHRQWIDMFFSNPDVLELLRVNRHNDISWFHKESGEELVNEFFLGAIAILVPKLPGVEIENRLAQYYRLNRQLRLAMGRSGYQLDKLKEILHEEC